MFGIPKVIFGSGATGFVVDSDGKFGLTQWCGAIVDDVENLDDISTALDTSKFNEVIRSCSVGKAEINVKILKYFNRDFWKAFM
jgi:hypothetical protein